MAASADALASLQLPWYEKVEGTLWNAATGTLTDAQKQALIDAQVQGVTAASDNSTGNVDTAAITAQATSDVTGVLKANNADPSQASVFNNVGLDSLFQKFGVVIAVAAVAALIYFVIEAVRIFRA